MSSILLQSTAGFSTLEKQLDVSSAYSIAQILGGAGLAVGLIFVIYSLATGEKKGWGYLISWFIAVLFYITFIS